VGVAVLAIGQALRGLCDALAKARPLRDDELCRALAAFFDADRRICSDLHDIANHLGSGRAATDPRRFREALLLLRDDLLLFGRTSDAVFLEEIVGPTTAAGDISGEQLSQLRLYVQSLQERLSPAAGSTICHTETDPPGTPPEGLGTILAADDDGYAPEWQRCLEDLGYGVETVGSIQEARATLRVNPGHVFVCDLHWHDARPEDVRKLLRVARGTGKCIFIVVVSACPLEPGDVPGADAVYGGVEAKSAGGARHLHRIIWKWSNKRAGATSES
jgi:hypothetical protein